MVKSLEQQYSTSKGLEYFRRINLVRFARKEDGMAHLDGPLFPRQTGVHSLRDGQKACIKPSSYKSCSMRSFKRLYLLHIVCNALCE